MTTLTDQPRTAAAAPAAGAAAPEARGTRWLEACRLDDLESCWGEAARLGAVQVALFRLPDGSVAATGQHCPATGAAVMARGIVGSRVLGGRSVPTVASPLHKEVYRLDTGECLSGGPLRLSVHRVDTSGGVVRVQVAA